jgi:SpoVK/Ycf46/Vps4 family AAA+-type ATPase
MVAQPVARRCLGTLLAHAWQQSTQNLREWTALVIYRWVIYRCLEADRLPKKILDSLQVSPEHFRRALKLTIPSTLRENAIEMPNVKWEDIGGLEDVKRELKETVQYPVQYADKFELFGLV